MSQPTSNFIGKTSMTFPKAPSTISSRDVLVVFGELFSRGYANGIVDEFEKRSATVIRSTVGRRENGVLRPLNSDEIQVQPKPFINVPLEAGFDLEPDPTTGTTPVQFFEKVKLSEWTEAKCDFDAIERSRVQAQLSFRKRVQTYLKELNALIETHLKPGGRLVFLHTMAGGVPRTKIIMPVMNRVFKGTGDRFVPSSALFESQLGRFALKNFNEVTAETFRILVEETAALRSHLKSTGRETSYLGFGYHGTDVYDRGECRWQTYTPYFQGWAKMELENLSRKFHREGIQTTCFNCPEILTNSSSIFQGVEVSLYPLLQPLVALASGKAPQGTSTLTAKGSAKASEILKTCLALLQPEYQTDSTFQNIRKITEDYLVHPLTTAHAKYEAWPQNNSKEQMELMLETSNQLIAMHASEKSLITEVLSEQVFRATGLVQARYAHLCTEPVVWIGHDTVAEAIATGEV